MTIVFVYSPNTAKRKADALRHPATGGGKKPAEPSTAEERILRSLEGRDSLTGTGLTQNIIGKLRLTLRGPLYTYSHYMYMCINRDMYLITTVFAAI